MVSYRIDYASYMQSSAWQNRKAKFFGRHSKKCVACGSVKNLHVHHRTYDRLGHERDSDLVCLCAVCHRLVHHTYVSYKNSKSLAQVTGLVIRSIKKAGNAPVKSKKKFKRRVKDGHKDPVSRAFGS